MDKVAIHTWTIIQDVIKPKIKFLDYLPYKNTNFGNLYQIWESKLHMPSWSNEMLNNNKKNLLFSFSFLKLNHSNYFGKLKLYSQVSIKSHIVQKYKLNWKNYAFKQETSISESIFYLMIWVICHKYAYSFLKTSSIFKTVYLIILRFYQ